MWPENGGIGGMVLMRKSMIPRCGRDEETGILTASGYRAPARDREAGLAQAAEGMEV